MLAGPGQWCEKHWQPYQEGNLNGLAATMLMMQSLVEDERFQRTCGRNPETGELAKVELLNEVLEQISPACCFLGDEKMESIKTEVKAMSDRARQGPITPA
jgi:hypothetical protein